MWSGRRSGVGGLVPDVWRRTVVAPMRGVAAPPGRAVNRSRDRPLLAGTVTAFGKYPETSGADPAVVNDREIAPASGGAERGRGRSPRTPAFAGRRGRHPGGCRDLCARIATVEIPGRARDDA